MTQIPEPPHDPAEPRAIELLRLVGSRTPALGPDFTTEVVTRARLQRALAAPVRAVGGLLAALGSALGASLRNAAGGSGRP
jgi:hypothetical protein